MRLISKHCLKRYRIFFPPWIYSFLILLLPAPSFASSILFSDSPENGTSLWATSSSTISSTSTLTQSGEPVAEGSVAIALAASNWTQAGLYIAKIPPEGHSILQAKIFRVAGSSGKLMFRRGKNWLKINLTEANNAHWTLDGKPGSDNYSDDTWHTLQIDLDGFGINKGERIIAIGVQGPKGTGYFYMDSVAFLSNESTAPITPPIPGNWKLTFEDNFDGNLLDSGKWQVGTQYLGMSGAASNNAENIKVKDGALQFTAEKRTQTQGGEVFDYASGQISTYRNFRQKYGYFEARIKYDAIQGVWPAFWLMPDRGYYGSDDYRRQALLKFDLKSVSATVSSAILQLKVSSAESGSSMAVHRTLTTDWLQNSVTWQTKPKLDPLWLAQRSGEVTGNIIEIDVTDYIKKQKLTGDAASFALVDNYMKIQLMDIFSSEAPNSNDRPVLIVNGSAISPTDDTYVRGGVNAKLNYGSEPILRVKDMWGNTSSTYEGGMEFDIMESLGIWGSEVNAHALHWDGYSTDHQSLGSGKLYFNASGDGYHTYGMYWAPGYVAMYIDGIQTWTYTDSRIGSVASYPILSLQMGGWDGNHEILDDQLPANMSVDYMRAWSGTAD